MYTNEEGLFVVVALGHMAEPNKWTPFGEFDPHAQPAATASPSIPASQSSTNPFFQRLDDVVFDPFANTPPQKITSDEKACSINYLPVAVSQLLINQQQLATSEKKGSQVDVKRTFDGGPTLSEEPQSTQVSSGTTIL
jgi:hypothetical protein